MPSYNSRDINYIITVDIARLLVERGVTPSPFAGSHIRHGSTDLDDILVYSPSSDHIWLVSHYEQIPLSEDMQASLALMPNHEARIALLNL